MNRIRNILFFTFVLCFLLVTILFVYAWKREVIFYKSTNFNTVTKSDYKLSMERIEKSDEMICNLIETLRTALVKKTIHTTDRILLNLFFISILQKNHFIKTFELILTNKYEYKIISTSSGWKTITLTPGGKGYIKKEATWTEDGTQLLEERVDEIEPDQSFTNLEGYKESISLCLQQDTQNREGIPKLWASSPEIRDTGPGIYSRMAMAIGYEDAPFSVIAWEMDWSWLQKVISDIYRDYSVYTYVLSDDIVVCKLGMESVSSRDIAKTASFQNLPEEIKELMEKYKEYPTPYFQKKDDGLLVLQKKVFLYTIPLFCVLNIRYKEEYLNTDIKISILIVITFLLTIVSTLFLGYALTKPIKDISHWLENPKVEEQESPLHFWIIEYEILMNKIYSILYFWKFWAVDFKSEKIDVEKEDQSIKKKPDMFVFSEEGKGGIPLEEINALYRENIRLQRQIEALNQYYTQKLELDKAEKQKVQSIVVGLRDIILVSNDKNKTEEEKIKTILLIIKNTLKVETVGIWQIEEDKDTLTPLWIVSENEQIETKPIYGCKWLIENMDWSEVLSIRSASQDYRSNLWSKITDAESIILAPIRITREDKDNKMLFVCSKEPKSWEPNDENFIISVSKILYRKV